ncbi:MAG TPA: GNAT family N-acetyltransferase [Gammaproteobacteria bacterium]|nr:GNAT family N-acetyltransferase [Gammaproteobacteria bacterium]
MQVQAMEIRAAAKRDADGVFELADRLDAAVPVDREAFDELYPKIIRSNTACCLVALAGDEVHGYASGFMHDTIYASGPVAYLDEMVVSEDLRHSGIGTQLVKAFEEWATESGCRLIGLAVEGAAPFYESLGYQRIAGHYRKALG